MIEVLDCVAHAHDLRLVALAIIVCLTGSLATVQLFGRILASRGASRAGWIALSAVGTGTMVWCTHFVAMMGFDANAPVTLDPALTLASLGLVILISAPGLALAAARRRSFAVGGGALVGIAIAAMHYTGMIAYRIDGLIAWRWPYVAASVLLATGLSSAAFQTFRSDRPWPRTMGAVLLSLAVAALHFTGMAAMKIDVLTLHRELGLSSSTMAALATATACASLLFIGCAAVSALIDDQTRGEAYQHLRRMAMHDGLTDLPNRVCFHETLAKRLQRKDEMPHLAVIMLDLSRFKSVNDTYGHHAGDQLLTALAARMTGLLIGSEWIARLGGDEFGALVSYFDRAELDDFLQRLAGAFLNPFAFERFSASVRANIGVVIAQDGADADMLLAHADLAMYRAKSEHSAVPCFYDATMDEAVRGRRALANELRDAIIKKAFVLHYQVQASIASGEIIGYEVLLRWPHPSRGMVPPSLLIPLAEEIGEIIPLSNWIINQACFEAAL